MIRWTDKLIRIEYQNRYVKAIVDNKDNIIMDVENYSDAFISNIVELHNIAVSLAYEEGLKNGVEIARKELGK